MAGRPVAQPRRRSSAREERGASASSHRERLLHVNQALSSCRPQNTRAVTNSNSFVLKDRRDLLYLRDPQAPMAHRVRGYLRVRQELSVRQARKVPRVSKVRRARQFRKGRWGLQ